MIVCSQPSESHTFLSQALFSHLAYLYYCCTKKTSKTTGHGSKGNLKLVGKCSCLFTACNPHLKGLKNIMNLQQHWELDQSVFSGNSSLLNTVCIKPTKLRPLECLGFALKSKIPFLSAGYLFIRTGRSPRFPLQPPSLLGHISDKAFCRTGGEMFVFYFCRAGRKGYPLVLLMTAVCDTKPAP